MHKISFTTTLIACLLLALVVLLLLRENPDLDPATYIEKEVKPSDPANPPYCPECNAKMELRYRHKDGEPFWGCKRYPGCKGTREWGGLTYADFKYRYEEDYMDWPEEERFVEYRKMIGVPKLPGAVSLPRHCPECYAEMDDTFRSVKKGDEEMIYRRCSRYPRCKGRIIEDEETGWPETDWEHPERYHMAR